MMYIRKQNRFTEKQIYPYISLEDFRLDLLSRIRKMATNNIEGVHSWESMSDEELLHLIIWNQIQRILLLLHFLEI